MKIAILYICTGRYEIFWETFYKSCEKFFIKNSQKHYYVFTDSKIIKEDKNVTVIPQENLGWPMIACMRYKILNKIQDVLRRYDYAFFFNSNMEFLRNIESEDFLPQDDEGGVVAALHSMNNKISDNKFFPYERNLNSTSCIPFGCGNKYYHSGILGGKVFDFLKLLADCEKLTDTDIENHIIPKVHDESVFNRYLLGRNFKELSNFYIYPTVGKFFYRLNPKVKIIQRNKGSKKYGGHEYLRGKSDIKNFRKNIISQKSEKIKNCKISIILLANSNLDKFRLGFNSVLAQYYQNYELIILDTSTDNIIKNFVSIINMPKIKYFKINKINMYEKIDKGLELSNGDYAVLLKEDDEFKSRFALNKIIESI